MSTKAQALVIFEKYFAERESYLQRMENGYQYESTYYAEMMQKVEQEVLQLSVGTVPKGKNLKKTPR